VKSVHGTEKFTQDYAMAIALAKQVLAV